MLLNNPMLDAILKFVLMAVALVVSIILHEIAHGYAALFCGDRTAKYAGRLSLNPARHFDLQGILMLLLIRVGYARPVPVNPSNFRKRRLGMFLVSIAGIVVNIILSFVFTLLYLAMNNAGLSNIVLRCITLLFFNISFYNLYLCFFNLLPLFPLDGYNLVESVFGIRNSVVRFLRNYGTWMLIGLFLLSIIVNWIGMPPWLDILGTYLFETSSFVHSAFVKLWSWVLGL